jgi:hypothetical protein
MASSFLISLLDPSSAVSDNVLSSVTITRPIALQLPSRPNLVLDHRLVFFHWEPSASFDRVQNPISLEERVSPFGQQPWE